MKHEKQSVTPLSKSEIQALIREFEAGTLPLDRWDHSAHLIVATYYFATSSESEAIRLVREGIRSYNAAQGIEDRPGGGYSETLTRCFLHLVHREIAEAPPGARLEELVAHLLNSRLTEKNVVLEHYSKESLFSAEGRVRWLEPDRKPLPS